MEEFPRVGRELFVPPVPHREIPAPMMPRNNPMNAVRLHLCLLAWLVAASSLASTYTQTLTLKPGWNAVWLEVDPPDRTPAAVFAGLPVASVWTWSERVSATDFIQHPESAGWNRAQWLAYFPPENPEAPLNNLHAVLPQRAYLIRLSGNRSVDWRITGQTVLTTPAWIPDRFNLRGFPVDDSVRPTFRQFFRASTAHFEPRSGKVADILRLEPDGQWRPVSPEDAMRRGEAYWVSTKGSSTFVAPFHLELNSGERVDFDLVQRRVELTLRNVHAIPKIVRIEAVGEVASALHLVPAVGSASTNAPQPFLVHEQTVSAGSSHRLRLGLDRGRLRSVPAPRSLASLPSTASSDGSLLRVSDGEGTLFFVGVAASPGTPADYTGLWVGSVTVTNVSPTLGTTNGPGTPGSVARGFPLRVLLHVDQGGQAALLREVTLVYGRNDTAGLTNPPAWSSAQPLELVTDPARLVSYSPSDIRSGAIRGRRLTAPHFEFSRTNGQFSLPLNGVFAPGSAMSGTLLLSADVPTHPFRHRYHPDHGTNAYPVSRDISLRIDTSSPVDGGITDPVLNGMFSETITGLHRLPLYTSGSLEFRRISNLGVLNATNTP